MLDYGWIRNRESLGVPFPKKTTIKCACGVSFDTLARNTLRCPACRAIKKKEYLNNIKLRRRKASNDTRTKSLKS